MYTSLLAVTIALTHFLLNPLNQVNRPNPRFLGFTCRMKPLFEYNGYHSGHFTSMTGISIEIPGNSKYWDIRAAFLLLHCGLDHVCQKCVRYSLFVIAENTFAHLLFAFQFSVLYYLSFFHYNVRTTRPLVWQDLQETIHLNKHGWLPPWANTYITWNNAKPIWFSNHQTSRVISFHLIYVFGVLNNSQLII